MHRNAMHPSVYRETAVLSSTPEQRVPLLYDGLLAALRRASRQIRGRDIEGKCSSLTRASDIVHELLGSLDFERGGPIARQLASLYGFWTREIALAGRAMDADRLDALEQMVASLGGAWHEAARMGNEAVLRG